MASNDRRPDGGYTNPETALGGADAVEKTTYAGNAQGTEPGGGPGKAANVTAQVSSGGGSSFILWIAVFIAVLVGIGYGVALFR